MYAFIQAFNKMPSEGKALFFVLGGAIFLMSIVLHEVMHGLTAHQLGDETAYVQGRLTLNPIRHLDPFFSLIMPLIFLVSLGVPFGGAKPVPVNPLRFRNPRAGMALTAIAGPATNLLIAAVFALLLKLPWLVPADSFNYWLFFFGALLNIVLVAFNLLPVPPLDGSRVVTWLLPRELAYKWDSLGRYGWIILVVLVVVNRGTGILSYPVMLISGGLMKLLGL